MLSTQVSPNRLSGTRAPTSVTTGQHQKSATGVVQAGQGVMRMGASRLCIALLLLLRAGRGCYVLPCRYYFVHVTNVSPLYRVHDV